MLTVPSAWLFFGMHVAIAGSLGLYSGYNVYVDATRRGDSRSGSWAAVIAVAYLLGLLPGFLLYSVYFFTRGALEPADPKPT